MPTLAIRPYIVQIRDDSTGQTRYLGPGGRLVCRRNAAAPLDPEVAEQIALATQEHAPERITVSSTPI